MPQQIITYFIVLRRILLRAFDWSGLTHDVLRESANNFASTIVLSVLLGAAPVVILLLAGAITI